MFKKSFRYMVLSLILPGMILLIPLGCGKKGPPVAPARQGEQQLAAPFGLTCTRDNGGVLLTWQHHPDRTTAFSGGLEFTVHMAKLAFDGCEGCPLVFQETGQVTAPEKELFILVETGFRYYFKVQAAGQDRKSAFSEAVLFEYR